MYISEGNFGFMAGLLSIWTKIDRQYFVHLPITKLWDVGSSLIYTMEYYLAIKKKEILPFLATWMDLESIMLSEISQSEKNRSHAISVMCKI